jgi:hypothetical protein
MFLLFCMGMIWRLRHKLEENIKANLQDMVDGVSRIREQWRDLVNTVTKNQAPECENNPFEVYHENVSMHIVG